MTKDKRKSKPYVIRTIIIVLCLIGAIIAGIMIIRHQLRVDDRNLLERRQNFNVMSAERNERVPEEMVIIQPGWLIRTHMDYLPLGKVVINEGKWWLEYLEADERPFGKQPFIYNHWERLEAHIYDVLTEERLDTINVLDILASVSDYTEGYNLVDMFPMVHGNIGEGYYLSWTLRKIPDSHEEGFEVRLLTYNLQTEEVSFDEGMPERLEHEQRIERAHRSNIFLNWDADEENRSRFINSNIGTDRDVGEGEHRDFAVMESTVNSLVVITLNSNYLPQESQELYGRFPGLRDFIGEEDLNVSVIISNDITNEEILLMFMEDGRDINFEGTVLRADWSIDGEEHEIHSFEDFDRLMDFGRWFNRETD
jgi:hypothetical protein